MHSYSAYISILMALLFSRFVCTEHFVYDICSTLSCTEDGRHQQALNNQVQIAEQEIVRARK